MKLLNEGKQPVHLKYGAYDYKQLVMLKSRALVDFEHMKNIISDFLFMARNPDERKNLIAMVETSQKDKAWRKKQKEDCAKWFVDYLEDVGYSVEDNPTMIKMAITSLFPPILPPGSKGKYTVDNIRPALLKAIKIQGSWTAEAKAQERANVTSVYQAFAPRANF
jgi:hypothetical protein